MNSILGKYKHIEIVFFIIQFGEFVCGVIDIDVDVSSHILMSIQMLQQLNLTQGSFCQNGLLEILGPDLLYGHVAVGRNFLCRPTLTINWGENYIFFQSTVISNVCFK